ncbi:hypothetical protein GGH92_004434, partial [Coemansia sp. RSA 2673]
KYDLGDTCVDSTRKPRKKGIKRGPYKKRKRTDSNSTPGRASTASTRAMALTDRPLIPPHLFEKDTVGSDTSKEEFSGLAQPPPISNSTSAVSDRDPGRPTSFRLPPIGSFDQSPPRRPHLTSNLIPALRAHSEQPPPPPPLYKSRSDFISMESTTRHPASPLGLLSDVAISSNTSHIRQGNDGHMKPPLVMSHSMHSLNTKPRFDRYISSTKHIPISSSRFDCTYRVPPRIPDDKYSASPWDSPNLASQSNYTSNRESPALPRNHVFDSDADTPVRAAREQTREMDSSCANSVADVQVRRLSSLLDRTSINHQPPPSSHNHAYTRYGDSTRLSQWEHGHRIADSHNGLDQTSNTGMATPQPDIRGEQHYGADQAWRPWGDVDSNNLPVVASIVDGCKDVPVAATLSQHKKSLSDYKL